jgi:ribosomal-protein-alanine N-acetyltransferase
MPLPPPVVALESGRLLVRPAGERDAPAILDYYRRNRARLEPWEPRRKPEFYTPEFWLRQVATDAANWADDAGYRFYLFEKSAPARVAGMAHLSNLVRGIAQYANLGYSLDGELEGRGLMREGLEALIPWAFGPLRLHRLMANYIPRNARSGALLERLGFKREGLACAYLRINGVWEDHVLTALTNPDWREE